MTHINQIGVFRNRVPEQLGCSRTRPNRFSGTKFSSKSRLGYNSDYLCTRCCPRLKFMIPPNKAGPRRTSSRLCTLCQTCLDSLILRATPTFMLTPFLTATARNRPRACSIAIPLPPFEDIFLNSPQPTRKVMLQFRSLQPHFPTNVGRSIHTLTSRPSFSAIAVLVGQSPCCAKPTSF